MRAHTGEGIPYCRHAACREDLCSLLKVCVRAWRSCTLHLQYIPFWALLGLAVMIAGCATFAFAVGRSHPPTSLLPDAAEDCKIFTPFGEGMASGFDGPCVQSGSHANLL